MPRTILTSLTLGLFTLVGTACDPDTSASPDSRAQQLAADLLEQSPDLAVLGLDDDPERIVAADDGQCAHVDGTLYCTVGDSDEPVTLGLTTPEPDPEQLGSLCYIIDDYLYCDAGYGGGGGGGCIDFECGSCVRRNSSYTGWAEYCGCAGWVACEP
jgi:hypothetical protein